MHMGIRFCGAYIELGKWGEANSPDDFIGTYMWICSDGTLTLGNAIIDYEHSRYGDITIKTKQYKTAPFRLALG